MHHNLQDLQEDDEHSQSTYSCFQMVSSTGDAQEEGMLVVLGASSDSSVPASFLMSSSISLVTNSPVCPSERWKRWETSTYWLSLGDDNHSARGWL